MSQTETFKHKVDGCLVAQLTDRHLVGEQASLPDCLLQRPPCEPVDPYEVLAALQVVDIPHQIRI